MTASPPTASELAVGDELAVSPRCADETQLFLYSAASHNPHRIHYDRDYARFEGHADLLVHGPLQGSWLTQYVADWAGPRAHVIELEIVERDAETKSVLMPATARVQLAS